MRSADVVILGAGLIGLAVAAEASTRGASVLLVGESRLGEASPAGAGMLAPGAESAELPNDPVRNFAVSGRDMYPAYLKALEQETGIDVPFDRNGILELVDEGASVLLPAGAEWIDARTLRELEPGLRSFHGAVQHPHDGAVDNVVLVEAMQRRVESRRSITVLRAGVRSIDVTVSRLRATLDDGDVVEGGSLVLATGAWVAQLEGLPRPLPVRPVRGQLLMLEGALTRHVIYGGGGYIVPRHGPRGATPLERTVVGATMEEAGFVNQTTPDGLAELTAVVRRVLSDSTSLRLVSHWAGLRPITPDKLPILGPDPDVPHLLYACGHGRNGILLAPITGEAIGALAAGAPSPHDISTLSIERFVGA